jgi:hypothetical protein
MMSQYKQIGNAVPVCLASAMARQVALSLQKVYRQEFEDMKATEDLDGNILIADDEDSGDDDEEGEVEVVGPPIIDLCDADDDVMVLEQTTQPNNISNTTSSCGSPSAMLDDSNDDVILDQEEADPEPARDSHNSYINDLGLSYFG